MTAIAGNIFMYQIPENMFGTTVSNYKVTEVDSARLPHWLTFDSSTRTIYGVPMVTDEGVYYINLTATSADSKLVSSDIFPVEVVNVPTESTARFEKKFDPIQGDFLQFKSSSGEVRTMTSDTKMAEDSQQSNAVCYNGETRAVVRLSVSVEDLLPRDRVDLVVTMADFVRRDPQSFRLTKHRGSNIVRLLEESVVESGPGDVDIGTVLSQPSSTELSWRLSCGRFHGVEDFSKVMYHNAREGVLTKVLGYGVIGWQVTSTAAREQRRKRQAAGFATPMPTPTVTLSPPSSIPTASPVTLSSPSAFFTTPLPPLPSLSLTLSPTATPGLVTRPTLEATESLSSLPVTPSTGISPSPVATLMPASSTPVLTSMSAPLAPSTASSLGVLPTLTSLEPSSPVLSFSPTVATSGISSLSLPTVGFETTTLTATMQPTSISVGVEPTTAVQLSTSILPSTGMSSSMELSTTPSITAVFTTTSSQLGLTPSPTPTGSTSALATTVAVQSSTPVPSPTSVFPALSSTSAVATSRKSDVVTPSVALSLSGGFESTTVTAFASASRPATSTTAMFETISELATLSRLSTASSASAVTAELATDSVFPTSVPSATSTVSATSSRLVATISAPTLATTELATSSAPTLATTELATSSAPTVVTTELVTSSALLTGVATFSRFSTSSATAVTSELATPSVVLRTSASSVLSGIAPSSTKVPGSLASSSLTSFLPSPTILPSPSPTSFLGDPLTPSTPLVSPSSASSLSSIFFTVPTTLSTLPTPGPPVVSSTAALVSNSTLPTPSPAVVNSTAVVSSSVSTPTVPPNQPPLLVNHLDHLQVSAGQVYYSRVPYDTFYDMEDAMNTRGLTLELVALDGTTWLFLNHEWQALYGIPPLDSADQIFHFILVVYDSQGLATRDAFQLTVTQPPTPSHIFTAVIDINYNTFQSDILSWISLSEKISTHFRDRTTNFILIDSVEEGSVVFSWSNISLSSATCQNATIQSLAAELLNPDGTVNPTFVTSLLPDYPVTEARVRYQGVCGIGVVSPLPTAAATLAPAPLSHSNHLLGTVVPAACIAAILLLLGVVACCLYRRKESGKKLPKYDKLTLTKNRKPIVLEDEVEMKDTKPSKPIVLPDEKPPATRLPTRRPAPPPYRIPDTQELLSGMEPQASALPPPPRYTASVPRKPPPPYRLPPPYTPSASPLPEPLSFADTKV
ncbi:PREDICTED: dystroglycan-like isoform X1 [Branchiostoma belcheri]|uniref:Dystroglycan 1 n=1 Tax=Branchiostoma belcheri TaxID=7741 RepID=A0A6P4ZHT8_BRABE|nr:PREDICTED: dystroglycan-like isoform X1 [Branchiostoma belcheri]